MSKSAKFHIILMVLLGISPGILSIMIFLHEINVDDLTLVRKSIRINEYFKLYHGIENAHKKIDLILCILVIITIFSVIGVIFSNYMKIIFHERSGWHDVPCYWWLPILIFGPIPCSILYYVINLYLSLDPRSTLCIVLMLPVGFMLLMIIAVIRIDLEQYSSFSKKSEI